MNNKWTRNTLAWIARRAVLKRIPKKQSNMRQNKQKQTNCNNWKWTINELAIPWLGLKKYQRNNQTCDQINRNNQTKNNWEWTINELATPCLGLLEAPYSNRKTIPKKHVNNSAQKHKNRKYLVFDCKESCSYSFCLWLWTCLWTPVGLLVISNKYYDF